MKMKAKQKKPFTAQVELNMSKTTILKSPYYENQNLPHSIPWLGYSGNDLWPNSKSKCFSKPATI